MEQNNPSTQKSWEFTEQKTYFWQFIKAKDRANFYDHLANMLSGGINVIQAIESFRNKTENNFFRNELKNLVYFLGEWDSLSKAMKKLPKVFNRYETNLIHAGENTGKITRSLSEIAKSIRKGIELRSKVVSALTYPSIILVFLILVIIVVMVFVIPSFIPLFEQWDVALPLSTRALIGSSTFVKENGLIVLIFIILFTIWFYLFKQHDEWRKVIDKMTLELPLVGKVYKNYILAKIAENLALLIGGGIPILKSLHALAQISDNYVYESALLRVSEEVAKGRKITESFHAADENYEIFPIDYMQMIESGEKTSGLAEVGLKLADQYEKEVDYTIKMALKWVEPLALLVAGIFVAWFAMSMFGALIQLTSSI